MTSCSEEDISLQIESPVDRKPKRRSSIFKPEELTIPVNEELFPRNYKNALIQENIKWKEAHTQAVAEYRKLRMKTLQPVQNNSSATLENFMRKAANFCSKVNNMVDLHENAINYLTIRTQELEIEVQATNETILEKINM